MRTIFPSGLPEHMANHGLSIDAGGGTCLATRCSTPMGETRDQPRAVAEHLRAALEATDDDRVSYHVWAALQHCYLDD